MISDDPKLEFAEPRTVPPLLHPICQVCLERARGKYNNFTSDDGVFYKDGFAVACNFVPHDENFVDPKVRAALPQMLSDKDWRSINSTRSPLLWGEENLVDPDSGRPWRAWDYQRGALMCPSPRKVLRFGRRCLPAGVPVLLADGSWRPVEAVQVGDCVVSLSGDQTQRVASVTGSWENGEKLVYRIKLSNGVSVDCTANHPFWGYRKERREYLSSRGLQPGWISIEDGLEKGAWLSIISDYGVWGNGSEPDLARLLGYLLTDGYITGGNQTPKFTNNNRRMVDEVKAIALKRYGYPCSERPKGNGWDVHITDGRKNTDNLLTAELFRLGLLGRKSSNKTLPSCVWGWDWLSIALLINRMFSGDGSVSFWRKAGRGNEWGCDVSLTSTSRQMLDQVRLLLLKAGVLAVIRKDKKPKLPRHRQVWKLHISSGRDILRFLEVIGPIYGKEEACEEVAFLLQQKSRDSSGFVVGNARFLRVRSIELLGSAPTYDIEVEGTHNFVANGFYCHNTGKSTILAVFILWYIFTSAGGALRDPDSGKIRKNIRVLVLAPQKSHIENLFDRMRAFLALAPHLAPYIGRDKRGSPQVISIITDKNVKGGNVISGFASGDSSGSKGLSARGQDADLVVLDEGAFVSSDVLTKVVNPILYTRPTTQFIISSTPSGISGDYFESVCKSRPDFAEFYVPATLRPDWDIVEPQIKKDFGSSQEAWDQEVLAKFTPAGVGVYRDDLVTQAQADFEYGSMPRNPNFVYTFGVDWNKEHGTEIAIVATLKGGDHCSYTVWAENIPKKDFTSPSGIARILELNRIWVPHWIYVDAGGGDGGAMLQHEGRRVVGKNPIDARLMNIVKTYDFGSKMELKGINGEVRKVPSKVFMVENSVRRFELAEIKYPRSDLVMTRQLNNYVVGKRTPAGVPVYEVKEPKWGDHRLDALNLALIAVRLEFPSFYAGGLDPLGINIGYVPPKDQKPTRLLLPGQAFGPAPNHHRRWSRTPRGVLGGGVVRYWGHEPPEDDDTMLGGLRRKKLRIGR
jgi:intein/homing endonuclease